MCNAVYCGLALIGVYWLIAVVKSVSKARRVLKQINVKGGAKDV